MAEEGTGNHRLRVMLVDDNPNFLRVIQEFLELDGNFEVAAAVDSATQAVSMARDTAPDAVVLDLGMPGMTGLEVLPLLRSALPQAKIIVLTLLDTDSYRRASMRAGADGFLSKSSLKEELVPLLAKVTGVTNGDA